MRKAKTIDEGMKKKDIIKQVANALKGMENECHFFNDKTADLYYFEVKTPHELNAIYIDNGIVCVDTTPQGEEKTSDPLEHFDYNEVEKIASIFFSEVGLAQNSQGK